MTFKFDVDDTVIPPEHRPPGSTNAALHELPVRNPHVHQLVGALLYLPRTGLVVVPSFIDAGGSTCVVVRGDETYPRGGYHLHVSHWELQRAVILEVDDEMIRRTRGV